MLVGGRSLAPPGQSQWTPRRDKSQPQVLLPNPRLRKRFKPQTTRNPRKNGTLPRISRIPRFSRLSILAACLNPHHFAPSSRGQPAHPPNSADSFTRETASSPSPPPTLRYGAASPSQAAP